MKSKDDRLNATFFVIVSGLLRCFTGPITGYIGEIFELRSIIAAGCFVASIGVGICYFAEDIMVVTVSLGFIYGIGYALSCNLLPQILKQHFTENIAIAVGITYLGVSIGGFAIIPAFEMLLNTYGVSSTLLITSGVMLHGVPVAMLLWNPKYKKPASKEKGDILLEETLKDAITAIKPTENETLLSSSSKPTLKNKEMNDCSEMYINTIGNVNKTDTNQVDVTVYNDIIKQEASMYDYQQSILISLSDIKYTPIIDSEKCKNHTKLLKRVTTPKCETQNKYRRALQTFAIFKNPSFLMIMLCQSVHAYVTVFICTTVIDISREKDILQSQENFILMLLPLAETIGFTCLGWMTDKGYLNVSNYMVVCYLFMGLSCCTLSISSSFLIFMVSVMVFGVCVCGISSVNPSLVYAFVDEKMHTMAIASRLALYVPFSFTMGPLIGYFKGTLGSYDGALYLLTAICIGCSFLLMLLPCLTRCTNRKLR